MFNATSPLTSAARALRNGVIIAVLSIAVNSSALAAETSEAASLADIKALSGADRNDDGIRDDLESFLKNKFGGDARMLRAVQNVVIAIRYALIATSQQASSSAHSMQIRASECMAGLAREGKEINVAALEELSRKIADTPARVAAIQAHSDRIRDQNFAVQIAPTWEQWCERPVDEALRRAPAVGDSARNE